MKNLTFTICLTLAVLLGGVGTTWSADFNKGLAAYESGDFATAVREWRPFAEQGNAAAQTSLGHMYEKGEGVPQDYKTSARWYMLAAEQGHAYAQLLLGMMYEEGRGVSQDYKRAAGWYTLAAEQGEADAQLLLGTMYGLGRGVIRDYVYAYMWGHIAASNGKSGGRRLRDVVAKRMTPADISTAQNLVRECVRKEYRGC
jgi:hypothetical protein